MLTARAALELRAGASAPLARARDDHNQVFFLLLPHYRTVLRQTHHKSCLMLSAAHGMRADALLSGI